MAETKEDPATFEAALAKLERLVAEMEGGTLSLDETMARFEEGRRLAAACSAELEKIRQRIEKVVTAADGASATVPLENV